MPKRPEPPRRDLADVADLRKRWVALVIGILLVCAIAFTLYWGITHPVGNVS